MIVQEIGLTGEFLPAVGIGTWQYTGSAAALSTAVRHGIKLIDTAELYGTEPLVGEAIAGLPRDDVFIASKVSGDHLAFADVVHACERSLKALGVTYIDLYQIHWPNPDIPIEATMAALESLVAAGKIRMIGVSNFWPWQIDQAQAFLQKHKIVTNQMPYGLANRGIEKEVIPYCLAHDMTVIAYSPLQILGSDVLEFYAEKLKMTPAQLALSWVAAQPGVIGLMKSNSIDRMLANFDAVRRFKLKFETLTSLQDLIEVERAAVKSSQMPV